METKSSCSMLINNLNSFPILFKSMKNISMETCFDKQKMSFVPFNAKEIFESQQDINNYCLELKIVDLETIRNLFSKTINDVCGEYYEKKLDVNLTFEIIDRIEGILPDVNDNLRSLSSKVPALTGAVSEFIAQNRASMKSINILITDSSQSFDNEIAKKQEQLHRTLRDLDLSISRLKNTISENENARKQATALIKNCEESVLSTTEQLRINRSSLGLTRANAHEILNLSNGNIDMTNEELIYQLEGYIQSNGQDEKVQTIIADLKAPSELAVKLDISTNEVENLKNWLLQLQDIEKLKKELKIFEEKRNTVALDLKTSNIKF